MRGFLAQDKVPGTLIGIHKRYDRVKTKQRFRKKIDKLSKIDKLVNGNNYHLQNFKTKRDGFCAAQKMANGGAPNGGNAGLIPNGM